MNRHRSQTLRSAPLLSTTCLTLMLCAAPAQACSLCATAMADRILPPVRLWCLIAALWYLGTVLIASFHKTRLPGVPGFVPGVLSLIACIVVCSGVTGPVIFLPLFFVAVQGFIRSVLGRNGGQPTSLKRGLNRLGYVGSAVVLFAACGSLYLRQQRTTADFIVRWSDTGPARVALKGLAEGNTPEDREQLRFVAARGTGTIVGLAEEALASR